MSTFFLESVFHISAINSEQSIGLSSQVMRELP
jgi:hypothetical protein